ncbi:MAG: response regulator [Opitutaceae bacterium]|jgi:two-component system, cell cycle sensor histidine kinase and response regulator CckA|nr:response regulator [Opitutaceae bacterium]
MNALKMPLVFGCVGLGAFALFVFWAESSWRNDLHGRVQEHVRAITDAVHDGDEQRSDDYLRLAADSYYYESILVHRGDTPAFIAIRRPELEGVDRILDRLGLFPTVTVKHPILSENKRVGEIEIVAISRTIFEELYALIGIALLMFIVERSLHVIEGKRTLERRVGQRTGQLASSEARLRQLVHLLDMAHDVIFVREGDGRISYFNKGAERIFSKGTTESGLNDLYRMALDLDVDDLLPSQGMWSGEFKIRSVSDQMLTLRVSISLVREDQRQHGRCLVIATDVSSQRGLENRLRRVERSQVVGTMTGGIAHNFNNLLTPILISVKHLQDHTVPPDKQARLLKVIQSSTQRGADLVRRLMNLINSESGPRSQIDLTVVLEDIKRLTVDTFPKTIRLNFKWPATPLLMSAGASDIHQAILNLCLNARDAVEKGGSLQLSAQSHQLTSTQRSTHQVDEDGNEWVLVTVSDDGAGISTEERNEIFDPFYSTKEPGQGTGLGLSTVQSIVRSHGGFIEMESEPDAFTEFRIFLPRGEAELAEVDSKAPENIESGSGTILLVDDEELVLESSQLMLEELGYSVITAKSGAEALNHFLESRSSIRVLMTDLMMPGMDGGTLIRRLRAIEPNLSVVAVTGLLSGDSVDELQEIGVNHIIAKPYRMREVERMLAKVLSDETVS